MKSTEYDENQILEAKNIGLIPDGVWFPITYSLVTEVASLKIKDKEKFWNLKLSKQSRLLRLYFRLAAINLLKYRDSKGLNTRRSRESFVYLIQDTKNPKYIKVGKSIEPHRRLSEANCFSPEKSFIILRWFYCEDAYLVENLVHRTFKDFNSSGEWFKVDYLKLEEFIKAQIHAPLAKLDKARSF